MVKRCILFALAMMVVGPLVIGWAGDPQCVQNVVDPNAVPFNYDPNSLVINPETGKRDIMCWIAVEVGTEVEFVGTVCDPDGDPIKTVWVSDPNTYTFAYDPNALTWSLKYTPTAIGVSYAWVGAVDGPVVNPDTARTRRMNVLVAGLPRNNPPVIRCGGGT